MTNQATIEGERRDRRPMSGADMLRNGRRLSLLGSVLSKTRLLNRVVRTLFKRSGDVVALQQRSISFLLLKPVQALMLAGIRCTGAGGGGPGR